MWYIKSALKVLLKNPIIWILTIILAAVFAAPVYEPLRPAWILDEITREQSKEDYENAKTNYEFALENPSFARNLETEKQLLELKRNIYESTTSAEYFDNNVKLIQAELDQLQSGRSIASESPYDLQAKLLYCMAMSSLGDAVNYPNSKNYPLIEMGASLFEVRTPLLLTGSAIIVSLLVHLTTGEKKLLGITVIGNTKRLLLQAATSCIASVLLILTALLPTLLFALVKNGVGVIAYPIVFRRAGEIVSINALECFLGGLLIVLCSAIFITLCAHCVYSAIKHLLTSSLIACAVTATLVYLPLYPRYFSVRDFNTSLIRFLPSTYFDVRNIVGYLGIWPTHQILKDVNLKPMAALIVLTVWSLVLLLLTVGITALKQAFAKGRYVQLRQCD